MEARMNNPAISATWRAGAAFAKRPVGWEER